MALKALLYKGGGGTCQNSGAKDCLNGGWDISYLELSNLHDFFQTMLTIQYTSWLFQKISPFSNNRNLVVPYKQVRHQSQLNILYMFYT